MKTKSFNLLREADYMDLKKEIAKFNNLNEKSDSLLFRLVGYSYTIVDSLLTDLIFICP